MLNEEHDRLPNVGEVRRCHNSERIGTVREDPASGRLAAVSYGSAVYAEGDDWSSLVARLSDLLYVVTSRGGVFEGQRTYADEVAMEDAAETPDRVVEITIPVRITLCTLAHLGNEDDGAAYTPEQWEEMMREILSGAQELATEGHGVHLSADWASVEQHA